VKVNVTEPVLAVAGVTYWPPEAAGSLEIKSAHRSGFRFELGVVPSVVQRIVG
jgi:hypothetical protein